MGIDPSPFWANLYLHDYEADFASSLIKTDKLEASNLRMRLPSLMMNVSNMILVGFISLFM